MGYFVIKKVVLELFNIDNHLKKELNLDEILYRVPLSKDEIILIIYRSFANK